MNLGLGPLIERLAESGDEALVLATVIDTAGPSYRKAGAMMLLAAGEPLVGLVSGGCLEADLAEHAGAVLASGCARVVTYDLRRDEDALWGLGLGCGGTIRVLLEPVGAADGHGGLRDIARYWHAGEFCWLAKRVSENDVRGAERYAVVAGDGALPAGFGPVSVAAANRVSASLVADDVLLVPVAPPPRVTICGTGPDALPVAGFAAASGFAVTVHDRRAEMPLRALFGPDVDMVGGPIAEFAETPACLHAHAAVVMSHHLQSDADYLRAFAASDARYIGVLGPLARRREVVALAGVTIDDRLFGPAGLDIGADLPETIALSILAELQAVLSGRPGTSLRA